MGAASHRPHARARQHQILGKPPGQIPSQHLTSAELLLFIAEYSKRGSVASSRLHIISLFQTFQIPTLSLLRPLVSSALVQLGYAVVSAFSSPSPSLLRSCMLLCNRTFRLRLRATYLFFTPFAAIYHSYLVSPPPSAPSPTPPPPCPPPQRAASSTPLTSCTPLLPSTHCRCCLSSVFCFNHTVFTRLRV